MKNWNILNLLLVYTISIQIYIRIFMGSKRHGSNTGLRCVTSAYLEDIYFKSWYVFISIYLEQATDKRLDFVLKW